VELSETGGAQDVQAVGSTAPRTAGETEATAPTPAEEAGGSGQPVGPPGGRQGPVDAVPPLERDSQPLPSPEVAEVMPGSERQLRPRNADGIVAKPPENRVFPGGGGRQ
jgi:hypothetical protein